MFDKLQETILLFSCWLPWNRKFQRSNEALIEALNISTTELAKTKKNLDDAWKLLGEAEARLHKAHIRIDRKSREILDLEDDITDITTQRDDHRLRIKELQTDLEDTEYTLDTVLANRKKETEAAKRVKAALENINKETAIILQRSSTTTQPTPEIFKYKFHPM